MSDAGDDADGITRALNALRAGDERAGQELIPMIYGQLRRMAAAKMAAERPGHTLQATALVHEAWLRLGDGGFENRAHFFGAAAEAMRRILVDRARRKNCTRHGSGAEPLDLDDLEIAAPVDSDEILSVHEALDRLAAHDPRKSELVKLRYFAGLSFDECAALLGISVPTAKRDWSFSRAWLHHAISNGQGPAATIDPEL